MFGSMGISVNWTSMEGRDERMEHDNTPVYICLPLLNAFEAHELFSNVKLEAVGHQKRSKCTKFPLIIVVTWSYKSQNLPGSATG
jgi:hypothetical protein